jgi:endonuclease G
MSPVTKDAYRVFIRERGYKDKRYWSPGVDSVRFEQERDGAPWRTFSKLDAFPRDQARHPVSGVCFEEALAFVRWLNEAMPLAEWQWTLPTEDMWEYAARGDNGFVYPWGDEFRAAACNSKEAGIGGTSAVGSFSAGRSWSGALDLAGNVWEFVLANDQPSHQCVLRGGSFLNTRDEVKSYLRLTGVAKDHRPPDFGFRVAIVHTGERGSTASEVRGRTESTDQPRPSTPPKPPDTSPEPHDRGKRAMVALLDDGIDVLHEAFLDADGRSRIVAIWDHTDPTGPPPAGFTYGTLHTAESIATYVATRSVPEGLGRNVDGHGSPVASIAAGRRQAGKLAGGAAPEASILLVKTLQDRTGIAQSAIDGLAFVDRTATERDCPVVVTASVSLDLGSHDGKSALEMAFDEFTRGGTTPGRAVVIPAGNGRTDRRHAELRMSAHHVSSLRWKTHDEGSQTRVELWASPGGGYRFRLKGPSGAETEWANERRPDVSGVLGNDGRVSLQLIPRHVDNGDTLVRVEVVGAGQMMAEGDWELTIEAANVADGKIHAWCESATHQIEFLDHVSENTTIGIPATASSVIAVGAALNKTPLEAAAFSALGPTRDGRTKPDIAAAGVEIRGARGGSSRGSATFSGTSMAAAHVTGAVALLLDSAVATGQSPPSANQIRAALVQTTRDGNGQWHPALGYGLVDVRALLAAFLRSR